MAIRQVQPSEVKGTAELQPRSFVLIDIAGEETHRSLWSPAGRCGAGSPKRTGAELGLPSGGFASPWGFWCCTEDRTNADAGTMQVDVFEPEELDAVAATVYGRTSIGQRGRLPQTVTVEVPGRPDEEVTLIVGTEGAWVFATAAGWEATAEAVLLVVAQYARFAAIEEALLDAQAMARRNLRHGVTAAVPTLRKREKLVGAATASWNLLSDWAYFWGPCSDPLRHCSSQESVEVHSQLSSELELEEWAERIESVAEDVGEVYDAITDKLFHYGLFIWGMVVEAIIIALIVALIFR